MTKYNPDKHHRRSIRLPYYDYREDGVYLFTAVTHHREELFGRIYDGQMWLSTFGNMVLEEWRRIPEHRPYVQLDAFVVMPNHVHGIIVINHATVESNRRDVGAERALPLNDRGAQHAAPQPNPPQQSGKRNFGDMRPGSLSVIIRAFKSAATKRINAYRNTPGAVVWQRNFWERVVRDDDEWNQYRFYIDTNPERWASDRENPQAR
ncbi:MAG: transposase [Chloroflexi bacterium]|nr:MAG: transposase [Chloroflexota bacterium]